MKELYRVINFIALERHPKVPWEDILPRVKEVLGSEDESTNEENSSSDEDDFGEIKVLFKSSAKFQCKLKLRKRIRKNGLA